MTMPGPGPEGRIPRREIITLRQYILSGSYKETAWQLGISESTARQRVSTLIRRLGVRNVTQATWALRRELAWDESLSHQGPPGPAGAVEGPVHRDR